jgi:hypothetical protein
MAWSDFYMITGTGSNLNAGSTTSGTPVYSSTSSDGTWSNTASTYTPGDGSTPATSVSVGDWCSIYTNQSATPYIAQVTSVGSGVNGVITLSTTNYFGTNPATSSAANIRDGGAWADFGMVASGAALNTGTVTQSTRINVKAGTYANTTTSRSVGLGGTTTAPVWWRGYQTTPGDQDANPLAVAGTNIPAITFSTGQFIVAGNNSIFSNLDLNGACTSTYGQCKVLGASCTFYHFRSQNTASNSAAVAFWCDQICTCTNCYFKATTTAAQTVFLEGNTSELMACYIGGGAIGLSSAVNYMVISRCVFDSPSGDAIASSSAGMLAILNCSFYGGGGNGVNFTALPYQSALVANSYFDSFSTAGKYAITNSTGSNTSLIGAVGNAYYNCAGNTNGFGDFPLIFDHGTLRASAFVAPSSQNFSLNSNGYNLGVPGTFELLSNDVGYLDVGALQHQGGAPGQIMRVAGQCFPVW